MIERYVLGGDTALCQITLVNRYTLHFSEMVCAYRSPNNL